MASYAGDATQGIPTQTGREPEHLHEFFEAQVAAPPDHTAIEALGKKMTYAELDRLANRIAHWLRARGIGPGSLVGLCQSKSCNLFASLLGILKAGAGYVPVDPKFPRSASATSSPTPVSAWSSPSNACWRRWRPDFCTRTLVVDTQADEIEQMPGSAIRPRGAGGLADLLCHLHVGLDRPPQGRDDRAPQRGGVRHIAADGLHG